MEKTDLVYILGKWSSWNDNEIRYSVRSAERYFDFRNLVVVGDCPEWLAARNIKAADGSTNKITNAIGKYAAAALDPEVSDRFVLMNDDFFFLKEIADIPYWSRGTLKDMIARHPTQGGYYFKSLKDTNERLRDLNIGMPLDFETHGPIVFDKEKLLETVKTVGHEKAYAMRSCYGNLTGASPSHVIDFKACDSGEFAWQIREDRDILSISDQMVGNAEFREWIERKFPKPSRFETDGGQGAKQPPGRATCARKYHAMQAFTYGTRFFNRGDVIDALTMLEIRENPRLNVLWELT